MEFIKVRNGYLVKGSNGLIVSEKEKKQLENGTLSIKGATCEACRTDKHKATATSKKGNKKKKIVEEVIEEPINEKVEVVEDDSIEETSIII